MRCPAPRPRGSRRARHRLRGAAPRQPGPDAGRYQPTAPGGCWRVVIQRSSNRAADVSSAPIVADRILDNRCSGRYSYFDSLCSTRNMRSMRPLWPRRSSREQWHVARRSGPPSETTPAVLKCAHFAPAIRPGPSDPATRSARETVSSQSHHGAVGSAVAGEYRQTPDRRDARRP